jgi:hypothetical protein
MKCLCLLILLLATPLPATAACRLALALALDVSGSVDDEEYRLQMSGVATALGDEDVVAALFAMPDAPVALAVYEWSSSRYQRLLQDWVVIEDRAVLEAVRARLNGWQRTPAPEATGLGASLGYGRGLLERAPDCWAQTLDVSGDGKNNDWPDPRRARAGGALGDIRINALVIARAAGRFGEVPPVEVGELSAYFRADVIQGPDAFVEVALGFEDYARAMQRKLLRELNTRPVGALPDDGPSRIALRDSGPGRPGQ